MDIAKYTTDIEKFASSVNTELVEKLVSRLSIILSNKDASLVSCADETEVETVKKNFVESKLGVTGDDADKAIATVCEKMAGDKMKSRVTFYYLLAVELGKEDHYINL